MKKHVPLIAACLILGTYFYYFTTLLIEPNSTFGSFRLSNQPVTLGEIGGFVAGVSTPIGFILLYASFRLQHKDSIEKRAQLNQDFYRSIQNMQPKFHFSYSHYEYLGGYQGLCLIFKVINSGKAALELKIIAESYNYDENDLIHDFVGGGLEHIAENAQSEVLKLQFLNFSEDSFDEPIEIPLFLSYKDITHVSRSFRAKLRVSPVLTLGLKASIDEQTEAI